MDIDELLIDAYKRLDAANNADGIGNHAECMYHLGALTGLLIKYNETTKTQEPPERTSEK